jgi:two-component system, NtrC family, sensor kinase
MPPSQSVAYRHTVLVVGDDELVLQRLLELLSCDEYTIVTAPNGLAALERFKETLPSIVLLDLHMPLMDGLTLCRLMKQDPHTAGIPILLVTGQTAACEVEAGLAAGASDYIKKPFDNDELRIRVRNQLRLRDVQLAHRRVEKEYQRLFETSQDALMTLAPPSWIFQSCNQATLKLFGAKTKSEFTCLGPWDVSPERQPDGCLSSQHAQAMIAKAMHQGSASFPWVHMRLDGQVFPCDVLLTRVDSPETPFLQATVRDVTERVHAAAALQASEARYRTSFEDASVGQALAGLDWRILEANDALATMLGYPIGELCGKSFAELTHPDDIAEGRAVHQALLQGQRVARGEKRYVRKDASALWADVSAAALRSATGELTQFVVHVIDLSARKRMETMLKHEEETAKESMTFLRAILNAIPIPVFYKDAEGRFLGANDAFETIVDKQRAEFVGKTVFDIFPQETANTLYAIDCKLLRVPGTQIHALHLESNRDVLVHKATYRDFSGQVSGIIGAYVDITDRKRAEAELEHVRKLEAVGQLAAGIAHEINTPAQYVGDGVHFLKEVFESYQQLLTKYSGAVDKLEQAGNATELVSAIRELENELDLDYLRANVPGSFERCIDGITRISTIVRAMKEFSHPDQREKTFADLNQALQSTLIIARNEYKYVANIETDFGDLSPVLCHVGDLNQVFLNLIVNAAHAVADVVGNEGQMGQIRICTRQDGNWVLIDIADSGTGIPLSIRGRIFDPFFTTKEVGKGSGQGLAIARSIIVDRHGGSLTFKTDAGSGTTFTIRLPIDGKELPKGAMLQ